MSIFRSISARPFARLATAAAVLATLAACAPRPVAKTPETVRLTSARLSVGQLQKLALGADPRALGLTPAQAPINAVPPPEAAQTAQELNAERPFANLPIEPMRPFVLKTDAEDKARAVHCLAQAVYYEAAREPLKGQEAVAQVVLNRLRHPAFPKTVCGVVYQGAGLSTGCQFTFTCDGSLRLAPEPAYWDRALAVARQALSGFVDRDVGSATHYHAVYVAPYWAPTLVKMTQVGQQIFYRWSGSWGEPHAFAGRYAGHEAVLTPAVLQSTPEIALPSPARQVTLAVADGARTYKVADPSRPQGAPDGGGRVEGTLIASRRQPTRDEVARINASLAALESKIGAPAGAPSAGQAATPALAQVARASQTAGD